DCTTRYDQGPVAAPSRRFSFCLSSRARVLIPVLTHHRLRVLGPEHGKFCIVLLNTQCEEVPMKLAQLRFHFGRKCLAIRHRLLTEFFPPIESARQESNRAHGSFERACMNRGARPLD